MATYSDDARQALRLTRVQVEALDTLSGYEAGETVPSGLISPRTLASLTRRGLVGEDGRLTPAGQDALYLY